MEKNTYKLINKALNVTAILGFAAIVLNFTAPVVVEYIWSHNET